MNYGPRVFLVLLITVLLTGINGLIAFILLITFSNSKKARDPNIKHGLSSGNSRLGGLAIFLSIIISYCFHLLFLEDFNLSLLLSKIDHIIVISFLIGAIGLIEDFSQNLSSMIRLISMMLIVTASFYFIPDLIPSNLLLFDILYANNLGLIALIISVVMVCGFINAGNMADGANGLLASIFFFFFMIAYSLDNSVFNFSVLISLLAFIIFNVSTGKIFLGDFGSYSLSALVAFKCLEFYSVTDISVFFMASILIYPCFEISRSLLIRTIRNTSVLTPDNNHLHNYLNSLFLNFGLTKHISNSITGLGIAFSTSIIPVMLFFSGVSINSELWKLLFFVEFLALSFIYILFEKNARRN